MGQHNELDNVMVAENHLKNRAGMKKVHFFTMKSLVILNLVFAVVGCSGNDPKPNPDPEQPTENSTFAAPKNVAAVVVNNGIQVSWDKVSGTYKGSSVFDALGYAVERSSDGSTFTSCGNTDARQTSFIDTNPLGGNNYYRVKAKYDASSNLYTDYSQSVICTYKNTGGTQSGLYLGIIGFNDALNVKDISLLNNGTSSSFKSFISNLTPKDGTVLYYSVDGAINKLQSAILPSDLTNISIVTFTDGLDQGSLALNSNYQTKATYLDAVHNRISSTKISGLPISAYSIGIIGKDVSNTAEFEDNLNKLASNSANVAKVNTMDEVNSKFSEIASSLFNQTYTQTLQLKIPVQENGAKIRFTFDNVTNAANSTLYIEGTYNYSAKSLQNIIYQGLSSSSGTTVTGTTEGIFVTFSFNNLKTTVGSTVPVSNIKQWAYETSLWQINSEFTPSNNTQTIDNWKSAVIILVLDCSTSLGSDFVNMKNAANNFIDVLLGGGSTTNPNTNTGVLINGVRWATCNVDNPGTFTANPEDAGKFYQWNSRTAWATTGSISSWNYNNISGTSWESVNDPSPAGWRVPTSAEFQSLINSGYTWTTRNGVNGGLFGAAPNQIFLPAVGERDELVRNTGIIGQYWSADPSTTVGFAWFLDFESNMYAGLPGRQEFLGLSVRCVAK